MTDNVYSESSLWIVSTCTIQSYYHYWGDQLKEDEMGRVCSTYEKNEDCLVQFSKKT
jgi:hypothetical protein